MAILALVKNNLVESLAVGDADFALHVKNKYDYVIDVTDRDRPSPGDSYYPLSDRFIVNRDDLAAMSVAQSNAPHLTNGTEDTFEPFKLSKYSVSYDKDSKIVIIGCKKYPIVGLLDALHKVLIDKEQDLHCFMVLKDGPTHGKFGITWNDAKILYETLSKVRF